VLDLWSGLPSVEPQPSDVQSDLSPRPGPARPETATTVVEAPFPEVLPPEPAPPTPTGPLRVERHGPVGDIEVVDAVVATFSHAMVPIATVEALERLPSPFTIEPAIEGSTQWLGTQNVALRATGRVPFSTAYEVTVPAGTQATDGTKLEEAFRWSFTTPTLALVSSDPWNEQTGVPLEPTIVLTFNQGVQPAILAAFRLEGGGVTVPLERLPAGPGDAWQQAREVRMKPKQKLRADTAYTLRWPAGVFGEGTLPGKAQTIGFRTYAPLKVVRLDCGDPCFASNGIMVEFNNQILDPKLEDKIQVKPKPEGFRVEPSYNGVHLDGEWVGNETYTVEIQAGLADALGQTLARTFTGKVKLGPHYPQLSPAQVGEYPIVIERVGTPAWRVLAAGLTRADVRTTSFTLSELARFLSLQWAGPEEWPKGIGEPTYQRTFELKDSLKRPLTFDLPLADMLTQGRNLGWVSILSNPFKLWGSENRSGFVQTFQRTDLGLGAVLDQTGGFAFVHRLSDGQPVAEADVQVVGEQGHVMATVRTDASGLARFTFASQPIVLTVAQGDDSAFMPLQGDARQRGVAFGSPRNDSPRAFLFTERTPYKPGETVHLAGVLRLEQAGPKGGVVLWNSVDKAEYIVRTPRGIEVKKGSTPISPLGTFTFDIETDASQGSGDYGVEVTVKGTTFYHSVPVEAFRTPEFEVEVVREDASPLAYGDTLVAQIGAQYLHGAPLVGGNVEYSVRRNTTGFRPPGEANGGFSFGPFKRPWFVWGRHAMSFDGWRGRFESPEIVASGSGKTDTSGHLKVTTTLQAPDPAKGDQSLIKGVDPVLDASTFEVEALVSDENRQLIAGRASYVAHPAHVYVGLRSDRNVLREGETLRVESVLVDLDGQRIDAKPVQVKLLRLVTQRKTVQSGPSWSFEYETEAKEISTCDVTSRPAPEPCEFVVNEAGTYRVRGLANDAQGRTARTELEVHVQGAKTVVWDARERRIDLVPDKASYEPGDTATLLVRSPFDEAHGFVVVEREGIASSLPIEPHGGTATVQIPIDATMMPKVTVSSLLVSSRTEIPGVPAGEDLGMPALATGEVMLSVSTKTKRIVVDVVPSAKEITPGQRLSVELKTTTSDGQPTSSAVAVMVVDEAVLHLMGFTTPNPLDFFIHERSGDVWMDALHRRVVPRTSPATPESPDQPEESKVMMRNGAKGGGSTRHRGMEGRMAMSARPPAPMAEMAAADAGFNVDQAMAQPVSLRTLFATTAFFDGDVKTGTDGRTTLEIEMPENLTTFRIMAVAVDTQAPDRFGNGEALVRVRKPLMLRPSLPRFANFGDRFEAAVMVDNQTDAPQQVLVGIRGSNVTVESTDQKLIDIPQGESREVRFQVAARDVGTMRLQFAAMSAGGRDATEVSLPVQSPAVAEAFADYGVTADAIVRTVEPPQNVLPNFGGLELTFSSTALSGLEDAVQYLVDYPYECAEQIASRLLPIFALGDILNDFPIASQQDRALRTKLASDGIAKLLAKQSHDGGFGYWDGGESSPYLSTWVTFALLEGVHAGFAVDPSALERALDYVDNFVRHGQKTKYGLYYDWTSRAFGLWLLSGHDRRGSDSFPRIWAERERLPLYARALLMSAAHRYGRSSEQNILLTEFRSRVLESAKTIHFAESTEEAAMEGLRVLMHSDVQTDAIALMAWLEVAPSDPILPKVMAGIMAERDPRKGGRWDTTHANAWALLAASRYYTALESEVPEFFARVWLDDGFTGEVPFKGRNTVQVKRDLPMAKLVGTRLHTLTLAKEGPGKLYYRLGLRYAPSDLKLPARDRGFSVYRTYEALPVGEKAIDPAAVKRLDDGSWQIKAGTDVKVTLKLVVADRTNFVVVDDPLPGGLEGQNPRFLTSAESARSTPSEGAPHPMGANEGGRWWYPFWSFSHTELRDDRMLLFADHLPAGVYTYSYTARATNLGTFVLPPTKAEAMYEPERFGHNASTTVTIVE